MTLIYPQRVSQFGNIKAGKNIIDIKIIPEKKKRK